MLTIKDKIIIGLISVVLLVVPFAAVIGCYVSTGLIK